MMRNAANLPNGLLLAGTRYQGSMFGGCHLYHVLDRCLIVFPVSVVTKILVRQFPPLQWIGHLWNHRCSKPTFCGGRVAGIWTALYTSGKRPEDRQGPQATRNFPALPLIAAQDRESRKQ